MSTKIATTCSHKSQRVITRKDESHVQVCVKCKATLAKF